jgi:hypothetical protein
MSGPLDAPNQQVVRGDQSGPGVATEAQPEAETATPEAVTDLDAMTKAELLEEARRLDVSPANNDMTKEELRVGIDAKLAEGG